MINKQSRFIELDILRGIAIVGMVVFHYFFLLDFFKIVSYDMNRGWPLVLARTVQFLFLSLVGVSLAISHKKNLLNDLPVTNFYFRQLKRSIKILSFALLITLVTLIFIPEYYVTFGVLHLIGVSVLLLMPLAGQKILAFLLAILAYGLYFVVVNIQVSQKWLNIFGFDVGSVASVDFFPIFPWISFILLGITLGNILYKSFRSKINANNLPQILFILAWFGKNSLTIYVLHIPLLLLAIFFSKF